MLFESDGTLLEPFWDSQNDYEPDGIPPWAFLGFPKSLWNHFESAGILFESDGTLLEPFWIPKKLMEPF